jgi:hypothetical protein
MNTIEISKDHETITSIKKQLASLRTKSTLIEVNILTLISELGFSKIRNSWIAKEKLSELMSLNAWEWVMMNGELSKKYWFHVDYEEDRTPIPIKVQSLIKNEDVIYTHFYWSMIATFTLSWLKKLLIFILGCEQWVIQTSKAIEEVTPETQTSVHTIIQSQSWNGRSNPVQIYTLTEWVI